jgi:protein TonB
MTSLLGRSGVGYDGAVEYASSSFVRFLFLSLAVHLLLLLLSWPHPSIRAPQGEAPVSVSILPPPAEPPPKAAGAPTPAPAPRFKAAPAPTRPSKAPAIVAKKSSPILEERDPSPRESAPAPEPKREEPPAREPIQPNDAIAERRLPTMKELLPPPRWSSEGQGSEAPVSLDTRNPQYVTYFGSIKRAIESVWEYPQLALKYGLQGKLLMEFSILGTGQLEDARILRSSGSNLLDDEALRAVRTAAPFSPIPSWIGKNRIAIIATFEYHDNRVNYRFMP